MQSSTGRSSTAGYYGYLPSQRELKVAVRKLTELARIYKKKNSPESGTVYVGGW